MSHYTMSTTIKDDLVPFHELSDYSLPLHDSYASFDASSQKSIYSGGDQEARINQLSQQVENLSLANARLMRTNRVLKLDSEKLLDQKAGEVKQALKVMTERNIRLQRANRLLKDEYDIQTVRWIRNK